jgi:hypothetical protein
MSLVPRSISVVVIGPMGDEKAALGAVPVSHHLDNIAVAISECRRRFEAKGTPLNLRPVSADKIRGGAIDDFVLLSIDQADLAVADISLRGASVFYELALLHALGRPTILIDYKSQLRDAPFYVKDQRVLGVTDFTVDELTAVLMEALSTQQTGGDFRAFWTNAITSFYTVPLVDASAANGLATGYFYNFARWMIMEGSGVLARMARHVIREPRGITHLAIVRPSSIRQMDQARQIVEGLPGFYRGRRYKFDDFPRDFMLNTIGPYIVDYPTPLESLTVSPSYIKVRRLLRDYPQHGEDLGAKLDERLISAYMDTILHLAQNTAGSNPNKLKFLTPEAIAAEIG